MVYMGMGLVFSTHERHAQFSLIAGKLHACLKTALYIHIVHAYCN